MEEDPERRKKDVAKKLFGREGKIVTFSSFKTFYSRQLESYKQKALTPSFRH